MLPDLIGATRDYWRKLDEVEATYRRNELTAKEVDAKVKALMVEPAILILAKRCSSPENASIVMPSEKTKRARTVERTGIV